LPKIIEKGLYLKKLWQK